MRLRFVTALVVLGCVGCGFTFERSSEVLDRRVAAIVAEPPELLGGAPMPPSVHVSALVLEPGASASPVAFEWRVCLPAELAQPGVELPYPPADPVTGRCPEDAKSLVSSGTAAADALEADVPVPPALGALLQASAQSGMAVSLWVTVQLKIASDRGDLYAIKRLVLSPPIPAGRTPNLNPRLLGLLFDGQPWVADEALELKWGACEARDKVEIVEGERTVKVCQHRIDPMFDDDDAQRYQVQALKRSPEEPDRVLDLREQLEFRWFVDGGQISRQTTATPGQLELAEYDPLSTRWREPSVRPDEPLNLWVVVRDGRGGAAWTLRSVKLVP